MDKVTIRVTIESDGEIAISERSYIPANHTAAVGWCIGEEMAATLISLRDCMIQADEVLADASRGFDDGIQEAISNTLEGE